MKVLSIIAQKPDFTGSGIYLREIISSFDSMGYEQAIVCGVDINDKVKIFDDENRNKNMIFPVIFNCESMPFPVVGMSDEMPYESTRYIDLLNDEKKLEIWKRNFTTKVLEVIEMFKPNIIVCHHLYLLTAIVEQIINNIKLNKVDDLKNIKVYGICHNTDLRQYKKINLERDFIKENISRLDKIFVPSKEHKKMIIDTFDIKSKIIEVVGVGYNNKIFYISVDSKNKFLQIRYLKVAENNKNIVDSTYEYKDNRSENIKFTNDGVVEVNNRINNDMNEIDFIYVGKIANKKGVLSFIKSINVFKKKFAEILKKDYNIDAININLVGGAGNIDECENIIDNAIYVADTVLVSENLINRKTVIDNIALNNKNIELGTELVNDLLLIRKQKRRFRNKIETAESDLFDRLKINIRFYGKKNQKEIAKMYNENDIFVLLSFSEGIPMVVIEALACGMKVLVSDLPGVKDFLNENTKSALIEYVTLPALTNVDNATNEELEKYEERIASGMLNIIKMKKTRQVEVVNLSWDSIAKKIMR